jgi:hypothetical protein
MRGNASTPARLFPTEIRTAKLACRVLSELRMFAPATINARGGQRETRHRGVLGAGANITSHGRPSSLWADAVRIFREPDTREAGRR